MRGINLRRVGNPRAPKSPPSKCYKSVDTYKAVSFFPLLSVRPGFTEMTVLGAAIAAGLAANVWKDTSQLPRATTNIYEPQIQPDGMYM